LVPSLTETLFALGCGDAVVAATRYCTEPAGTVERIDRVGGTKNPDLHRIRALDPDLVLVNAEENRKEDFEALERAGLTVFVSFTHRARAVIDLLRKLGELTGTGAAARRIGDELTQTLAHVESARRGSRPRIFCPIWKNPWMSFNRDTYADDMLWLAGGQSICRDRAERYCQVRLGDIAAEQPEVILLPDEPYVFRQKDLQDLELLRATAAFQRKRIHFIDGKALSWYGPRTARSLPYLQALLAS
jgi:ABC-type Fe3+-hydroxamate transport system substrate-binding protein